MYVMPLLSRNSRLGGICTVRQHTGMLSFSVPYTYIPQALIFMASKQQQVPDAVCSNVACYYMHGAACDVVRC